MVFLPVLIFILGLIIGSFLNDVATGVRAILDGAATVYAWESAEVSFEAGDTLSIRLSTASWGPTSADLQAMIEVELV